MAAPIGHIYLALKMLSGPLNGVDEQKFLIGTSFPDIRYTIGLTRESTHANNVTWQRIIQESDPFRQGMLFHAFVDQEHEKFIREENINILLPNIPYALGILKGLEDQILFEEMPNRTFLRYFDKILEQERAIVPDEQQIRNWHTALQNYFFYGPTVQTVRPLLKDSLPDFGPLQPLAEHGAAYGFAFGTELIKLNGKIIQKIKQFYQTFSTKFLRISH